MQLTMYCKSSVLIPLRWCQTRLSAHLGSVLGFEPMSSQGDKISSACEEWTTFPRKQIGCRLPQFVPSIISYLRRGKETGDEEADDCVWNRVIQYLKKWQFQRLLLRGHGVPFGRFTWRLELCPWTDDRPKDDLIAHFSCNLKTWRTLSEVKWVLSSY